MRRFLKNIIFSWMKGTFYSKRDSTPSGLWFDPFSLELVNVQPFQGYYNFDSMI